MSIPLYASCAGICWKYKNVNFNIEQEHKQKQVTDGRTDLWYVNCSVTEKESKKQSAVS